MSAVTSDSTMVQAAAARVRLRSLARRLRDAVLDVVWRQWRAVGGQAAGHVAAHAIVDPEALLLMSLVLEREEPRLTDILHDWALLNSHTLSVQRAKNLSPAYPAAASDRLPWVARIAVGDGKDLRWRPLAGLARGKNPKSPDGARTNKRRAVKAPLSNPSALLLRLRVGLGVGAKADLLSYLLGIEGRWATVREITAATAYTTAAVRRAAEDMSAARLLQVRSSAPAGYRVDPAPWREVLDLRAQPPAWRSWHERFAFAAAFLEWAKAADIRPVSEYALGVQARELLDRHREAFERDLVMAWDDQTASIDAMSFSQAAVDAMAEWMVQRA
ncbi:MAG: hypothetical protein ACT4P7_11270 [Gemmatimonadaceae bacterium]